VVAAAASAVDEAPPARDTEKTRAAAEGPASEPLGKRPERAAGRSEGLPRSATTRAARPDATAATLRIRPAAEADEAAAAPQGLALPAPPALEDPLMEGASGAVDADLASRSIAPSPSSISTARATPPPTPSLEPDGVATTPDPAPKPGSATVRIEALDVRGSLATSEVRRAVARLEPQLAACHARAERLAGHGAPATLSVAVEIDERGRARAPRATGSALPGLARCVARAVSKLSARPPDTGTVKAQWKVTFAP
jgi:hypothetical protein